MKKTLMTLLLSSSLLATAGAYAAATASLASASNSPDFWPANTWYGELNVGTNLAYVAVVSSYTGINHGAKGWGWSGALGYNFTRWFALEGGFMQNYAKLESDDDDANGDKAYVSAHTNVPYIATRFTIPMNKFGIIFKLGGMYADVQGSGSANTGEDVSAKSPNVGLPFTGIGVSYAVTPKLHIVAQYQGAVYVLASAGLASLGLNYRF